ncbi:MAG: preprotein translocase subunit SecG [Candidatus Marinimicrobia bacterium]|nr:preprotein translocase subunit SecG [Candidatus Neomarinimicrobiota bacterium]
MLYYLLVVPFILMCFLLIFIIFLQKGKGSMGLGSMGGGTQMLFGGSGGQDLFQKATWVMIGFFLFGSLSLSIYKTKTVKHQQHLSQSAR